jgi:hypothetical protein
MRTHQFLWDGGRCCGCADARAAVHECMRDGFGAEEACLYGGILESIAMNSTCVAGKERVCKCECEVSMYLGGFWSLTALLLNQVVLQTQLVEIWY